MCGIIGYNGEREAKNILIKSLKKLEYRGYDSAGIALAEKNKISALKSKGKLKNLDIKAQDFLNTSTVGIGHTRWATHGEANETNAHPHVSNDGMFSVVHNGIIENFSVIKEELQKKGFVFYSNTDTEVIPQLLSYHYDGDVLEAMRKTLFSLEGAYAISVLCRDFPDTVYAAKKSSPLVVARGKSSGFVASDISALDSEAKEAVHLSDGEIAVIKKDDIAFFDFNLNKTEKEFFNISKSDDESDKGQYEHFMLKEIFEQPEKIENLLNSHIENHEFYFDALPDFETAEKIYIISCGSAYHAGLAGKFAIEEMTRIPVEVNISSEFRYSNPILSAKTPVIIISQSGETADSIAALRLAKENGAKVLGIVNVVPSTIANESDFVIEAQAGREIAVATTKGYTTQVTVLYMLALHIAKMRKALSDKEIYRYANELLKTPEKIRKILSDTKKEEELAEKYCQKQEIFFIGRNTDFAAATESSLKLKEISYINCSAFPAGELKHGTIALIEKGTPVFAIAGNKRLYKKTLSNVEEVSSRGGDIVLLTQENTENTKYVNLKIPECSDIFLPLLEVIPMQLFSYYTAKKKGCDIDMPKNLAKSVTVE